MGNYPSICGVDGGVIINDDGITTCYTISTIVNVTNLQSVQNSDNTSVQAFTDYNGNGSMIPIYAVGYTSEPIKSILITVHWTKNSIFIGFIITVVIVLLIGYLMWRGHKYYKKWKNFDVGKLDRSYEGMGEEQHEQHEQHEQEESEQQEQEEQLEQKQEQEHQELEQQENEDRSEESRGGRPNGYFSMKKYNL